MIPSASVASGALEDRCTVGGIFSGAGIGHHFGFVAAWNVNFPLFDARRL